MTKTSKLLKNSLGVIVLAFGIITLTDFITKGYNPQNPQLMTFSKEFQALHNSIMQSYLGLSIRIIMIFSGLLLLTKRYWLIGLLIYLPISVNILAIHLCYDLPPAHTFFFGSGILVSIPSLILLYIERKRLKTLVV